LLNASYDPTREFYQEFNAAFTQYWLTRTGDRVRVLQSHAGSSKQARAVSDGLPADVVTLALAYDIDAIAVVGGRLATNWQSRFPYNSAPYTSTIVFLVRPGNPKHVRDWNDLVKPGLSVIMPNPKTSGGARWAYLAAYGYARTRPGADDHKARAYLAELLRQVPILDTGARGAATTFLNRNVGDVLITWENEAFLALKEQHGHQAELVVPATSILAEPAVAVVDRVARRHGTETVARAYLDYLYSETGQETAARHGFRPRLETVARQYAAQFATARLFTIDEVFGGWAKAHAAHFRDGGLFDLLWGEARH
jgi:sulfate transport system substrate-binding protein